VQLLVRLQHLFSADESTGRAVRTVEVDLQGFLAQWGGTVLEIDEVTLTAATVLSHKIPLADGVTLTPMQIRTFIATVA
jgi:hypothetical protein